MTIDVTFGSLLLNNIFFFYSCFHLYGYLPYTYLPPFSPFHLLPFFIPCHFLPYHQSYPPPPENVTAAILSYAVSHVHEGTGKLRKTCADTVDHFTESVPSLQSLKKMTSRSAFRCAGRRLAVTHPSSDPVKSCLTWVIAWHRTSITHRTLSVPK